MFPPRQAVIFCGGRGERLRPLTDTIPKPMAPVGSKPFLEYLIEQVRGQGIEHVLLLTGYKAQAIWDHFGDSVDYSHTPEEWETGARLWNAREKLDPQFLLMYGDTYAPFDMERLAAFHVKHRPAITTHISPRPDGNVLRLPDQGEGRIFYDPDGTDLGYIENGYMFVERDPLAWLYTTKSFNTLLAWFSRRERLAGLLNPTYISIDTEADLARAQSVMDKIREPRGS